MQRAQCHSLPVEHTPTVAEHEELVRENRAILADPHIIHYDFPDRATLKQLVMMGQAYRGSWYHSQVTFYTTDEVDPTADLLRRQVERMGRAAGFVILHRWIPRPIAEVEQAVTFERLLGL